MRIEHLPDTDTLYIDLAERAGVDSRPLRAKTSTRTQVQCHPREPPACFHHGPLAASFLAMISTRLNALSGPQWIGSTKYSTVGWAAPMTRS